MAEQPQKPAYMEHHQRGMSLQRQGKLGEAIALFLATLKDKPHYPPAHNSLGNAFREQGKLALAKQAYLQALVINPTYRVAHSNLLFLMGYHLQGSTTQLLEESRCWDIIHGRRGRLEGVRLTIPPKTDKRLRIGYVSSDFRKHSVRHFLEPILGNHDRNRFKIYCYAEVEHPDATTERLKSYADVWRFTVGVGDAQLAQIIRNDQIDILVDLAGHTAGNRLVPFTYRPAPIQVSYLGYFATTGLQDMDYWITDSNLHPKTTQEKSSETLYRLPRCWVCYQPPSHSPDVLRTDRKQRSVTFGSFNNLSKINADVVELWSRILRRLPDAKLLLKTRQLADPETCNRIIYLFAREKIGRNRLVLLPRTHNLQEHLKNYTKVDIALDPFPCTGGTMTAEALWMGTPVITLKGDRFIERMSTSMLRSIGADTLITDSKESYVHRVIQLALNPKERQQWHLTLRHRLMHSDLLDARHLVHTLEEAFLHMLDNNIRNTSTAIHSRTYTVSQTSPIKPVKPYYATIPPISLELTNQCNLNCPYCGNHNLKRPRGEIHWPLLEKLVDDCRNTHTIDWLHGTGEPLLYSRLEEAITLIKNNRAGEASFGTNGTLMTTKRANALLKAGLSSLYFSLDSLDPKIYQETRGASFNKVIRNIKNFIKIAPDDFPITIALMNSKVQTVNQEQVMLFNTMFDQHSNVRLKIVENTLFPEASEDYCRSKKADDKKPTGCFLPRNFFTIVMDGRVSLCCVDQDVKHVLGNIRTQTPQEIWFDPRNQQTFEKIATAKPGCPSVCTNHCLLKHL